MARTDNLENFLTDIADSIRTKKGTESNILASKFDEEISSIQSGSEPILQSKEFRPQITDERITPDEGYDGLSDVLVYGMNLQQKTIMPSTSIQNIMPDEGKDGLSKVTIGAVTSDIDANIISANIRKGVTILGVEGIVEEGSVPTGTINITSNGTYDVKDYANASVNVGETTFTKGFIVNKFNASGYATDVTLIGITNIPGYHFTNNTSYPNYLVSYLETISSNDVEKLNDYSCSQSVIKTASFPNCKELGYRAFQNSHSLKSINIDSVEKIGGNAFYGCNLLELDHLPEALISIGSNAFQFCNKINIKEIPSNVTSLGSACFQGLTNLTEMTIKSENITINNYVFNDCSNLSKLVLENVTSVPTLGTGAIQRTAIANGTGYIYVPDALVDGFKIANGWSTYANQIKGISEL